MLSVINPCLVINSIGLCLFFLSFIPCFSVVCSFYGIQVSLLFYFAHIFSYRICLAIVIPFLHVTNVGFISQVVFLFSSCLSNLSCLCIVFPSFFQLCYLFPLITAVLYCFSIVFLFNFFFSKSIFFHLQNFVLIFLPCFLLFSAIVLLSFSYPFLAGTVSYVLSSFDLLSY